MEAAGECYRRQRAASVLPVAGLVLFATSGIGFAVVAYQNTGGGFPSPAIFSAIVGLVVICGTTIGTRVVLDLVYRTVCVSRERIEIKGAFRSQCIPVSAVTGVVWIEKPRWPKVNGILIETATDRLFLDLQSYSAEARAGLEAYFRQTFDRGLQRSSSGEP